MKKAVTLTLTLLLVLTMLMPAFSITASAAVQKEYYIATDGNDSNPGTMDAPFASLEAARDAIRAMKQANGGLPVGGIRVYLRGGTYMLNQGFKLTAQDSGTRECPIIYTSYPGEEVYIYGGAKLDSTKFATVSDKDALARIPKTAAKQVRVFDLKSIGIENYGKAQPSGYHIPQEFPMPQLYYNDEILNLARWPNEGFERYGAAQPGLNIADAKKEAGSDDPDVYLKFGGGRIYIDDPQLAKWANAKDVLVFGYFNNGWAPNTVVAKEINTAQKYIQFEGPTAYTVLEGKEYYVSNLLEELDAPGEWYLDRDTGMLYIYPQGDIKTAAVELSTLRDDLFHLEECDYITIANLNMGLNLGEAVQAHESQNVLVRGCKIFKTGSHGVFFTSKWTIDTYMDVTYWPEGSVGTRSKNNGVVDCEIFNTGSSGVEIANGDRINLIGGEGFAENNVIHDYARINRTYTPAVNLWGAGNSARFNKIYNAPHIGVQFNGNDLSVEYNEFYNVVQETDDSGVIYAYGQNSYIGGKVNYNYIHDIASTTIHGVGVMGIYLDDHICATEMIGNVLSNVKNTGFFLKGKNNVVRYNILNNVSRGFYFSDFDVGRPMQNMYDENKRRGFFDSAIWKEKYPYFAEMAKLEGSDIPSGNIAEKNVFMSANRDIDNSFGANSTIENNLDITLAQAGFVDGANGNFNLKADSEILKKFPDFPQNTFDKIGTYTNRFKAILKDQVSLCTNSPVAFKGDQETRVDPANIDVMPVIENSRALVPVRFIAESFGANIDWNAETGTATIALDGKTIQLTINSDEMLVNGSPVKLEVPAQSVNSRTLIPLRALVESLDKKVLWDPRGLISIGASETPFGDDTYLVDALLRYFR